MPDDDVPEPRTLPTFLEAGVSGMPRQRAWDTVSTLEMPELRGSPIVRVSFQVLAPGQVEIVGTDGAPTVDDATLAMFVAQIDGTLSPPFEARAVRTSEDLWSVAARTTNRRPAEIELPQDVEAVSVACAPDGELTVHIDGELMIEVPEPYASTVTEILRRADAEHDAFVARLERFASGNVALSIDPL